MRTTIHNYLAAEKARREESGEAGFSLIELIVVVVILGILAAIAVPVFLGLQGQAQQSALESITANGASQTASDISQGNEADIAANLTALAGQSDAQLDGITLTNNGVTTIDGYCVTGAATGLTSVTSGPGC
ncbi:prepilin-type N-terminal cleavage/methylation domain-containing protein [Microbacterium terricola]|uniref:Prepilin-type N-terminal cleavage/methylation domain-containing protein n=1 Tax=Microbacterium terricola TaxID=344163 RepID=A0ABM8DXR0_9MICO|nr:prepilin-type N-terminal cleavage/methylation domain-containing protein [Microbacterium terricola]UYK38949.1 prepilin-type N-terminal cleavage/methylation domain-containing protein [Microbacterium terricola]BDV30351.1 hypothetical protein Microterr_10110 [Microbacterium terricola]